MQALDYFDSHRGHRSLEAKCGKPRLVQAKNEDDFHGGQRSTGKIIIIVLYGYQMWSERRTDASLG